MQNEHKNLGKVADFPMDTVSCLICHQPCVRGIYGRHGAGGTCSKKCETEFDRIVASEPQYLPRNE